MNIDICFPDKHFVVSLIGIISSCFMDSNLFTNSAILFCFKGGGDKSNSTSDDSIFFCKSFIYFFKYYKKKYGIKKRNKKNKKKRES